MAGKRAKRKPERSAVAANFPVFAMNDYDFVFQHPAWPIGLQSTFPEELKRRIAAAMLSCQFGYSGVDYAYRTYTKHERYDPGDPSRLDWQMDGAIKRQVASLGELIFQVTPHPNKRHGEIISEWCFMRVPHSIELLVSCSHKGALFESAAIARTILEQIAWACRIDALKDLHAIKDTSATKAIGALNRLCPVAGRLYGWLSSHSHWTYEAHIKAFEHDSKMDKLFAVFASSEFKATSLCLAVLISIVATKSFVALKPENVARVLASPKEALAQHADDQPSVYSTRRPSLEDMNAAVTCASLLALLRKTVELAPSRDIRELVNLASEITAN
jgi:hypothetical protein